MSAFFSSALDAFASQGPNVKQLQRDLAQWQQQEPLAFLECAVGAVASNNAVDAQRRLVAASMLASFLEDHSRQLEAAVLQQLRESLMATLAHDSTLERVMTRKLCEVLARVARDSFPQHWPSMLNEIAAFVGADGNSRLQWTGLMLLHQVIRLLHIRRGDSNVFEQTTAAVAPHCIGWISGIGARIAADGGAPRSDVELFVTAAKVGQRIFTVAGDAGVMATLLSTLVALLNCSHLADVECAIERLLKVLLWITDERVSTLTSITSPEFFREFLPLLADLIERFATQKVAGRAMRIFSRLLEFMMHDEGIAGVLNAYFGDTSATDRMLRVLVQNYLGDDQDLMDEWLIAPEEYVLETDVKDDMDDLDKCAEALFLSLLEEGGETVRQMGWAVINEFLTGENSGDYKITAALRAIGVCYHVLALSDEAKSQYREFLFSTLLPMVQARSSDVSVFVLRRVIWVIGMWCPNVVSVDDRRAVHNTLCDVLASVGDAVIVMTTLRTIENFLSDALFDPQQMPVEHVTCVFGVVQSLVPRLETPGMVEQMANLLLAIFSHRAIVPPDADFAALMLSTFGKTLDVFMCPPSDEDAAGGVEDGEGEDEKKKCAAFCAVLDAYKCGVHRFRSTEAVWQLLHVVRFCTDTSSTAHTWTEGHAWDLLAAMCQATRELSLQWVTPMMLEVLQWCVAHSERDFDGLGGCIRATAAVTLALSGSGALPRPALSAVCAMAQRLIGTTEDMAFGDAVALADVLCLIAPAETGPALLPLLLDILRHGEDVQVDSRTPGAAMLLCRLLSSESGPAAWGQLPAEARSDLCERLGLAMDVTPSRYGSRLIVATLARVAASGGFPRDDDVGYVRQCIESDAATAADDNDKMRRGETAPPQSLLHMYLAAIRDDTAPEALTAHHERLAHLLEEHAGELEITTV